MRRVGGSNLGFAMVLALVLVGALAGCGDGHSGGGPAAPTATSSTTASVGAGRSHLQGPHSAIADGLIVPIGAKLAGEVFREPPYGLSGDDPESSATSTTSTEPVAADDLSWDALLVID